MLQEIDNIQLEIMLYIKQWANTEKVPISRKKVIEEMTLKGNNEYTVIYSLSTLITKGYIRRAYSEKQNQTFYVLIRNV